MQYLGQPLPTDHRCHDTENLLAIPCKQSQQGLKKRLSGQKRKHPGSEFDPWHPCNELGVVLSTTVTHCLGSGDGRIIGACWLPPYLKTVRSWFREHLCFGEVRGERWRHLSRPLASTCMHVQHITVHRLLIYNTCKHALRSQTTCRCMHILQRSHRCTLPHSTT